MLLKLFPQPTDEYITPFSYSVKTGEYLRYCDDGTRVSVSLRNHEVDMRCEGDISARVFGIRSPNRAAVLKYCKNSAANKSFIAYIESVYVVPTYSSSVEERFVRAVTRQIVSARQAKKTISRLIKKYGYCRGGVYAFPARDRMQKVTSDELKAMGLGFRADRIVLGLKALSSIQDVSSDLQGVGPWTNAIMAVDKCRDYKHYPFWDKSGQKIIRIIGIDVDAVSTKDKALAADLYVYAASFLENES